MQIYKSSLPDGRQAMRSISIDLELCPTGRMRFQCPFFLNEVSGSSKQGLYLRVSNTQQ